MSLWSKIVLCGCMASLRNEQLSFLLRDTLPTPMKLAINTNPKMCPLLSSPTHILTGCPVALDQHLHVDVRIPIDPLLHAPALMKKVTITNTLVKRE